MDNLPVPDEPAPDQVNETLSGTKPRPWMRYWARLLDIQLFAFPISLVLIFLLPEFFQVPRLFQMAFILPLILILEAGLLATVGTTPGKWLLGISIRSASGGPVAFGAAVRRGMDLYWRGMGCAVPPISLFTMINAESRLSANGQTTWDVIAGLRTSHLPIPWWKGTLTVAAFVGILALNAL